MGATAACLLEQSVSPDVKGHTTDPARQWANPYKFNRNNAPNFYDPDGRADSSPIDVDFESMLNQLSSGPAEMWRHPAYGGTTFMFNGHIVNERLFSMYLDVSANTGVEFEETTVSGNLVGRLVRVPGGIVDGKVAALEYYYWVSEQGAGNTLTNPTGLGIRNDDGGQGHYGAPRGNRLHYGIDFLSVDGQDIVSPVSGRAINSSFPKKLKDGRTIDIPTIVIIPSDPNIGFDKLELLYVGPIQGGWRKVSPGDIVGQSVNLQGLGYPPHVTPHIHLQMRLNRTWVNPTPYFPGLK